MSKVPDNIWLFRITHINNLDHILKHGLVTFHSPNADPDFVQIGDNTLIDLRVELEVPKSPFGKFSEYIPFYFGPRSPMLFQIATGYDGIKFFPQEEIIYVVSKLEILIKEGIPFVFTDGHARAEITSFYGSNELDMLTEIDWYTVFNEKWNNDESDKDRQRKKQAECLIFQYLPMYCIERILVFNESAEEKVVSLIQKTEMTIPVQISKKAYYGHISNR